MSFATTDGSPHGPTRSWQVKAEDSVTSPDEYGPTMQRQAEPEAQPDAAEALQTELRRLEQRIRRLQSEETPSRLEVAGSLADIDRKLQALSNRTCGADLSENARSDQVLADVDDWRQLCCRLRLDDSVDEADRLRQSHLKNVVETWKQALVPVLADPNADTCFQHLQQTRVLNLGSQSRSGDPSMGLEGLGELQGSLRQALRRSAQKNPPSAQTRQRWVTELLDRGDIVMTSIDDLPPQQAAAQISVVADYYRWHLQHIEMRFGKLRRLLRRKLSQIQAEGQELRLQHQLEERFGRGLVAASERVVLLLIFLVIGLMAAEALFLDPIEDQNTIFWFNVVDATACGLFLCEFFTKLWIVPGRMLWLRRHFLIDFIPSIPFALLTHGLTMSSPADAVRLGRLFRFLRLPRLVRYVRVLRPIIRVLRGFGLLARGLDRLARRYGHILNQNVILYPTRTELDQARSGLPMRRASLRQLHVELRDCWIRLLSSAPQRQRAQIAGRRLVMLGEALSGTLKPFTESVSVWPTNTREVPAGVLIDQLRGVTPHLLEAELGEPLLSQLARMVRIFSAPPLRWFPFITGCVPDISDDMTDAEVTTVASQRLSAVLKRFHDAWFWVADLYGTVTPSQFVDRVGTTLVNSSFRPAYKLALFGGILLLTELLLYVTALTALEPLEKFLGRYVGVPVMILGGICFLILALGWWLKRLAREATEFYERSAQAQYLSLMETIRSRQLQRDATILYNRVLRPEWLMAEGQPSADPQRQLSLFQDRVRQSLLDQHPPVDGTVTLAGFETTVLLYRDWLDGALLTNSDTRTTSQLLGNPAVRQFLSLSERITRKEVEVLQKLDLVRQKSLFGGPYLWFNFISRSIAHSVACLLVDYNQNTIPLADLPRLQPGPRERYQRWLAAGDSTAQQAAHDIEQSAERKYVTTAFTAMHFLDVHPRRDQDVETRFGPEVLSRLKSDRSLLIRRIFGTYPMHNRPKEQRVVNLYSLYGSWLAGGRALLFPLLLFLAGLKYLEGLLTWIARSVQEIRHPELRRSSRDAAQAHFFTAVRKIERIRGPVVAASLRLRSQMDPEFLGVLLPGRPQSALEGADIDADLAFLNLQPELAAEIGENRLRAEADMKRLETLIQDGLLQRVAEQMGLDADAFTSREHVRSAAIVYLADIRSVRRFLSARQILDDVYRMSVTRPPTVATTHRWFRLRRMFGRYWRQHGFGNERTRHAAWKATRYNFWGVADALLIWHRYGDDVQIKGEQVLGELLLHPGRITEQLMTVRSIQTLAVLDILHYREHVYQLGRYADMGDSPGHLLRWNTVL